MIPLIPLLQTGGLSINPDNLIATFTNIFGIAALWVGRGISALIILAVLYIAFVYFIIRPRRDYPIPVRMHEYVGGKVKFSHVDKGGFIVNRDGSETFKLMKRLFKKKPFLIQPKLSNFNTTLKGKRYINYVRTGKDIYIPAQEITTPNLLKALEVSEKVDLSSIHSQIKDHHAKLAIGGFWSKYGSMVSPIEVALIMGIFL